MLGGLGPRCWRQRLVWGHLPPQRAVLPGTVRSRDLWGESWSSGRSSGLEEGLLDWETDSEAWVFIAWGILI